MLKKSNRLNRAEFDKYFKSGRRFNNHYLTTIYSPFPTLHASVVVGKKVAKKAHDRNRLRRRVYDKVRQILYGQKTGVYIIILKPQFAELTKKEGRLVIEEILDKIGT